MCGRHRHFNHWTRHMAAVPKGFLRHCVLRLLNENPMSGSEIMTEIENRTNGHWRPSPGSIYPLLSWLQDKGYSREVAEPEPGIKRYELTEQGKELLEKSAERRKELRGRIGFFAPPFVGPHWYGHLPEETSRFVEAGKRLVMSSWTLLDSLRETHSEEAAKKATEVFEQATKKIEEINKEIRE